MNKAFTMFEWKNEPSVDTPLSADFLNKVNFGLNEVDNRVVTFSATKANQSDYLTVLGNVVYDEKHGIIQFTKPNGAKININIGLSKIESNLDYDNETNQFILKLADGKIKYIDASELIKIVEFSDSNTVLFSKTKDGKVTANIAKGSITEDMLQPNFLADVKFYSTEAIISSENAKKSEKEAKKAAERAKNSAFTAESINSSTLKTLEEANKTLEEVGKNVTQTTFSIDFTTGNLLSESPVYNFTTNESTGNLEWSVK